MPEHESLVASYVHLAREQRPNDALHTLKKIASQVKPIMRARGWKVGQLAEFYPDQTNLLGLNVNRGAKILLRLRYPGDRNQFLPFENVLDTMLHELAHIVHGPHDERFHALWDQLRDECQGLIMKGYTGEGFLGGGHRLGGADMPIREARRLAREAAEKRRVRASQRMGSGQRLGGVVPRPGQDVRQIIASAAERRNAIVKGCGSERFNEGQIIEIADTATRNGFKTQAEEDEANEAAIAQALWELVQEDEQSKHGQSYVRPSAGHPGEKGGASLVSSAVAGAGGTVDTSRNVYHLDPVSPVAVPGATTSQGSKKPDFWVCQTCTLHNPLRVLACEACGLERTLGGGPRSSAGGATRPATKKSSGRSASVVGTATTSNAHLIDLTGDSPPRKKRGNGPTPVENALHDPSPAPEAPWVWICNFCGTAMERQWWTCSVCGKMKESSR